MSCITIERVNIVIFQLCKCDGLPASLDRHCRRNEGKRPNHETYAASDPDGKRFVPIRHTKNYNISNTRREIVERLKAGKLNFLLAQTIKLSFQRHISHLDLEYTRDELRPSCLETCELSSKMCLEARGLVFALV